MKKLLFAGLAVAAMAALSISCQKNELQTSDNRHPVSFEASISATPGTKFSMTDKGSYVKASWEVGDEIAVLWFAGSDEEVTTETYVKFTVTKVSDDGKSATFTNTSSNFPPSGVVTAMFAYPYREFSSSYQGYMFAALNDDLSSEKLANPPGEYAVYYAKATVTDGSIPSVSFFQQNSFLFIKQGTVFSGVSEGDYYLDLFGLKYLGYARSKAQDNLMFSGRTFRTSWTTGKMIKFDKSGAIKQDVWIPFFPESSAQFTIAVVNLVDGKSVYEKAFGQRKSERGKVYDISEGI